MKVEFNTRERLIINGLLSMALGAAMDANDRKLRKYAQRLSVKFEGNGEVNLKPKEASDISDIIDTVIADTQFDLPEGELPNIYKNDYEICKGIKEKLVVGAK